MIPDFDDVVDRWIALLGGSSVLRTNEALIRRCLRNAQRLVEEPFDEPAALFYVFAERAHEFPRDFPVFFVDWITVSQVRVLGLPVPRDWKAFRELRVEATLGLITFEEVRGWFERHYELGLTPFKRH